MSISQSNTVILGYGANVGIGTSTPSKKLEVVGSDALINGATVGLGGGSSIENTAVGINALQMNTATGVNGRWNTAVGVSALQANTA